MRTAQQERQADAVVREWLHTQRNLAKGRQRISIAAVRRRQSRHWSFLNLQAHIIRTRQTHQIAQECWVRRTIASSTTANP